MKNKQQGYVLTLSEENYSLVIDALSYYAHVSVLADKSNSAKVLHDHMFDFKIMCDSCNGKHNTD